MFRHLDQIPFLFFFVCGDGDGDHVVNEAISASDELFATICVKRTYMYVANFLS